MTKLTLTHEVPIRVRVQTKTLEVPSGVDHFDASGNPVSPIVKWIDTLSDVVTPSGVEVEHGGRMFKIGGREFELTPTTRLIIEPAA